MTNGQGAFLVLVIVFLLLSLLDVVPFAVRLWARRSPESWIRYAMKQADKKHGHR